MKRKKKKKYIQFSLKRINIEKKNTSEIGFLKLQKILHVITRKEIKLKMTKIIFHKPLVENFSFTSLVSKNIIYFMSIMKSHQF